MAKLDPLEIARMSYLLTEAYGEIERHIILLMVKRLMDGPPELPAEMDTWKAEKLLQSAMLRRETAKTIKRMGANIPDYLDRLLYRAWRNGHGLQDMTVYDPDRLGILGSAEAAARRSYMKSKVRENALHELNRVNTSMLRSGQQKYIDILNDATDRVVTRDVSPYIAIKEASQRLLDEGLTGFTDRADRRWQVETATEMIVRKAANDAGNLAVFSHMEEEGVELLLVSAHKGARPLCSMDQGRVFSLKGFEGTVKDGEGNSIRVRSWASSTYGHPAGILGINCRHHIVPFYEGRSVNTQERPDDEENAKQYKLEQEQRRRERELRNHKRLRDTANALGDREEELRQKRIIRAKGKKLRGFIDEHGLTRNELRERNMTKVKSEATKDDELNVKTESHVSSRNMASGMRRSFHISMTEEDIEQVQHAIKSINADQNIFVIRNGMPTSYIDEHDIVFVSSNAFPSSDESLHPRDKMSLEAVLAHEYYGHRRFRNSVLPPNSWNDEFRASYFATVETPNLDQLDRVYLIQDAVMRAEEAGVSIRYNKHMRRILYGYEDK